MISEGSASLGHRLLQLLSFRSQVIFALSFPTKMVILSDNVLIFLDLFGNVLEMVLLLIVIEMFEFGMLFQKTCVGFVQFL